MQTRAAAKRLRDAERQSETSLTPPATTQSLAPAPITDSETLTTSTESLALVTTTNSLASDAALSQRSSERIAIARSLAESSGTLSLVLPSAIRPPKDLPKNKSIPTDLASYFTRYLDDDSDAVEPPRKRQRIVFGQIGKRASNSSRVVEELESEDGSDYEPEDLTEYKSDIQETRVTRRSMVNNGYKIEQKTTERFRKVVTVTKASSPAEVPFKKSGYGPFVLTLNLRIDQPFNEKFDKFAKQLKARTLESRKDMIPDTPDYYVWSESQGKNVKKNYGFKKGFTPYDYHVSPTPAEVKEVRRRLERHHTGLDLSDYGTRVQGPKVGPAHGGKGSVTVDDIVQVYLAQTTSNELALTSHARLCREFTYKHKDGKERPGLTPNYHTIVDLEPEQLKPFVAHSGLFRRAWWIIGALNMVRDENLKLKEREGSLDGVELGNPPNATDFVPGLLSLDFLGTTDDIAIKNWLLTLPNFGLKSASCMLEFNYRFPECAVDTHVLTMSAWIGWLPHECHDPDQAYMHLMVRIPPDDRHPIHQDFWHHKQDCVPCRTMQNGPKPLLIKDFVVKPGDFLVCPLEDLIVKRFTVRNKGKRKPELDADGNRVKKEPLATDFRHHGYYKNSEIAAKEGWVLGKLLVNPDFGASGKNIKEKPRWEFVGIREATKSLKQSQSSITTFFSVKTKGTKEEA